MTEPESPLDLDAVKYALRTELAERGHHLASDTSGPNRALYIMGPNDVAAAVFELKPSADEAIYDLMYQGAWVGSMPPRFVVVPVASADADSLETLEQMRAHPLLFDIERGNVRFRDLDSMLTKHLGRHR